MDNAHESMRDMIDIVGADGDVEMPTPDEPAIPAIKSRIPLDDGADTSRLGQIVDRVREMQANGEEIPQEVITNLKRMRDILRPMMGDTAIEESSDNTYSLENMAPKKDKAGRPTHNRSDGQSYQQKNGWIG